MKNLLRATWIALLLPFALAFAIYMAGYVAQAVIGLLIAVVVLTPMAFLYQGIEETAKAGKDALELRRLKRVQQRIEAASDGSPYGGWSWKRDKGQCPRCGHKEHQPGPRRPGPNGRPTVGCSLCGQVTSWWCWNGLVEPNNDPCTAPTDQIQIEP